MIDAYKPGVDCTLLRDNLKVTPEERFLDLQNLQEIAAELQGVDIPKLLRVLADPKVGLYWVGGVAATALGERTDPNEYGKMTDSPQQTRFGEAWTRDELVLAFDLYCRIPFKDTKAGNPLVCELASLLGRSPGAVARKLGNFGAFDPELHARGISGLSHGSRLDKAVWDEFHHDWNNLVYESYKLRQSLRAGIPAPPIVAPTGESERRVLSKQRVHQTFFRDTVLSNYDCTCCITGLRLRVCLIAAHIVPWCQAERFRVDPTNGLCLSATFERLFDAGMITISEDLSVCLSNRIRDLDDALVHSLIAAYDGRPIIRPNRFMPSTAHLEWHRNNIFIAR